jgi:hypothetical protein
MKLLRDLIKERKRLNSLKEKVRNKLKNKKSEKKNKYDDWFEVRERNDH